MVFYPGELSLLWDQYPTDNVRRFSIETSGTNINDMNVHISKGLLSPLLNSVGCIILTSVNVMYQATTSGAGNIVFIRAAHHPSTVPAAPYTIRLGQMTTTATFSFFEWEGSVVVDWFNPDINAVAGLIQVTNSALAETQDDIWIWASGELHEPPKDRMWNEPQPVSLEGYKWPLTKRRV